MPVILSYSRIDQDNPATPQTMNTFRDEQVDLGLLDSINVYKNWDTHTIDVSDGYTGKGKKSLFNNFYSVQESGISDNTPLRDTPENANFRRVNTKCTVKDLVDASKSGVMGRAMYSYIDFMYCKDLGKIANNHLLTLRRFAQPCSDEITPSLSYGSGSKTGIAQSVESVPHGVDVGRLVSWFGNEDNKLEDIMKYNVKMKWKELTAKIEDKESQANSGAGGFLNSAASILDGTAASNMASGQSGAGINNLGSTIGRWTGGGKYSTEHLSQYDNNKVYGPIDVIMSTQMREEGLWFDQEIKLVFDYELRAYGGINPRMAMTDLLANVLAVTYNSGTFWGGARRVLGARDSNVFQRFGINSTTPPMEYASKLFSGLGDVFGNFMNAFGSTDSLVGMLKNLGTGAMNLGAAAMQNTIGRPNIYAFQSLLSPAPTGMWHLTVGNPRNPIAVMGNLIMTDCNIQHYGPLGFDDFPTGLRVEVSLKHGKSKDNTMIEQMYTGGRERIYYPMGKEITEIYNTTKMNSMSSSQGSNSIDPSSTITTIEPTNKSLILSTFGASDEVVLATSKELFY